MDKGKYDLVIVGGGVIGCSCAYYTLKKNPKLRVCVIEPCEVAAAASGRSGGFLAESWCDGDPRHELTRQSYSMFPGISEEARSFGFGIQFRKLNTRSLAANLSGSRQVARAVRDRDSPEVDTSDANVLLQEVLSASETREGLPWLDGRHFGSSPMCSEVEMDTAQVHPRLYTRYLAHAAATMGAEFVRARCTELKVGPARAAPGRRLVRVSVSAPGPRDVARSKEPEHLDDSLGEPMAPSPLQSLREWAAGSSQRAGSSRPSCDDSGLSASPVGELESAAAAAVHARQVVLAMGPWTGGAEEWVRRAMTGCRLEQGHEHEEAGEGRGRESEGATAGKAAAKSHSDETTTAQASKGAGGSPPNAGGEIVIPVGGQRCHSVVFRPEVPVDPPCALFVGYSADPRAEREAERQMDLADAEATERGKGRAVAVAGQASGHPSGSSDDVASGGGGGGSGDTAMHSLSARKLSGRKLGDKAKVRATESDTGASGAKRPRQVQITSAGGAAGGGGGGGAEESTESETGEEGGGVGSSCETEAKIGSGRPRLSSVELYPRPDGTVYAVAGPDAEPLPQSAGAVTTDPQWCRSVRVAAGTMADSWATAPVEAAKACYLPTTPDGMPAIGRVPGLPEIIVAAGHSCWGILMSPATGLAVAELVSGGKAVTVGLKPFALERFEGLER